MTEYLGIPTAAGTFDAIAAGPEDGRGVLLLHGFPEAGIEWTEQVDALGAAGCRAVAPDQRGYSPGVRPEDVRDYQLVDLVGDVLAIADALGWQRFDLVGHDWGAAVAWQVAGDHPQRLRTLTAVSVPHPTPFGEALREDEDQQLRSQYIQLYRSSGGNAEKKLLAEDALALRRAFDNKIPPSHLAEYLTRLREPGALTAALNWYRANPLQRLTAPVITVPTLYVWSTEDVAIGSTAALATESHVSAAYRFEMVEDISHWVPEEAPETMTGLLLQHLSQFSEAR
ncbi:MAG TPA: alpha/beta hydrolase [Pseudonocardiaceae bacterium]|nr:alpha/beta hydrolase [Pseudonocardiaceae bacterium]